MAILIDLVIFRTNPFVRIRENSLYNTLVDLEILSMTPGMCGHRSQYRPHVGACLSHGN